MGVYIYVCIYMGVYIYIPHGGFKGTRKGGCAWKEVEIFIYVYTHACMCVCTYTYTCM